MSIVSPPLMPGTSAPAKTPPPAGGTSLPWSFQMPVRLRPLRVDQYVRMTEAGILGEDDPVELLEGFLVEKMPRNTPHDNTLTILNNKLVRMMPEAWIVRCQCAAQLGDSFPEPDFAIAKGDDKTYRNTHPTASEIDWIVEISDTSLARDRIDKARIYARAGIPVYWIVNVIDGEVEILTDPTGPIGDPIYRSRTTLRSGETAAATLKGQTIGTIAVDELF